MGNDLNGWQGTKNPMPPYVRGDKDCDRCGRRFPRDLLRKQNGWNVCELCLDVIPPER